MCKFPFSNSVCFHFDVLEKEINGKFAPFILVISLWEVALTQWKKCFSLNGRSSSFHFPSWLGDPKIFSLFSIPCLTTKQTRLKCPHNAWNTHAHKIQSSSYLCSWNFGAGRKSSPSQWIVLTQVASLDIIQPAHFPPKTGSGSGLHQKTEMLTQLGFAFNGRTHKA